MWIRVFVALRRIYVAPTCLSYADVPDPPDPRWLTSPAQVPPCGGALISNIPMLSLPGFQPVAAYAGSMTRGGYGPFGRAARRRRRRPWTSPPLNITPTGSRPDFPQRSPPWLLTTAACGGLRSTPDCRTRRTLPSSLVELRHGRVDRRTRDARTNCDIGRATVLQRNEDGIATQQSISKSIRNIRRHFS